MRPHFVEWQLSAFEKTDEKWARDIQEVGRLLGCQLSVVRHQSHRIAFRQLRQQGTQKSNGGSGQNDGLIWRTLEPNDARFP